VKTPIFSLSLLLLLCTWTISSSVPVNQASLLFPEKVTHLYISYTTFYAARPSKILNFTD
jgi:hypothetical protein